LRIPRALSAVCPRNLFGARSHLLATNVNFWFRQNRNFTSGSRQ
jgi:hypothetical protein